MANTNDVKTDELRLPDPFQPINFKIDVNDEEEHYARFVVEPLERGFGLTVGNALRRVLLSALPGASVFAVEIEGVRHEGKGRVQQSGDQSLRFNQCRERAVSGSQG